MMKLQGARVIAIDDQKPDLDGIVRALHRDGVSVLPFLYSGRSSLIKCQPGVRIVFSDINLEPRAASPHSQHQAVAAVLETVLHEDNGPWILAAWTASPDQVPALEIDLRSALGPKRAPLAAVALEKSKFIDARGRFRIAAITREIRTQIGRDPVVGAILDLEARALEAAREITHTIVELATRASGTQTDNTKIANILNAISKAADSTAPSSPEGVFQTLGPVFEDRLARKRIGRAERQIWTAAFNAGTGAKLDPRQVVALNTSLHLDARGNIGERGSLSLIPMAQISLLEQALKQPLDGIAFAHFVQKDKALKSLRDIARRQSEPVKPPLDEAALLAQFHGGVRWSLLEAAAACDASNDKRGLRRAIVGLVVPDRLGPQTVAGDHVIGLPPLSLGGDDVRVFFSARFVLSPIPRRLSSISPSGRLRNPLLDAVLQHVSGSQSRLGWISF